MAGSDDELEVNNNQNTTSLHQLTLTNSNAKFPYLKREEYDLWAMKMQNWITNIDWNLWEIVRKGNSLKRTTTDADGIVTILGPKTAKEFLAVQRENKVRTILLQAIPDDHMSEFHYMEDAKDIWMAIKARFGGNEESRRMRKSMLNNSFKSSKSLRKKVSTKDMTDSIGF